MPPTVLTGGDRGSEIIQNEVFGPVVTVQVAADEDEMVRWANDTAYVLSSRVWSENLNLTLRISRALRFGTAWVDTHLWTFPEAPFGGFDDWPLVSA